MPLPDYKDGSIVNLMSSIVAALGGENSLYAPLSRLAAASLRDSTNIVLVVIDGLGHDYLLRTGVGSALHHYLQGKITSVFPSTTATAITAFLTGNAPQQHALTGWFTYFKELGSVTAVLPFQPRHGGAPLRASGIDVTALFELVPVFNRINAQSFVVTPQRLARSAFSLALYGRAKLRPYTSLNQFFETMAGVLHENEEQKLVFAYWPELDHLAHVHGIGSPAAAAHFAELDAAFRRFLIDIHGSQSTVIVTADHGIIDSGPAHFIELDDHPALAETLILPLCGERRVAYCYVRSGKREEFESHVHTELAGYATLFHSEELLEQGCFGLGLPHPRLLARIGDYTLIMKENYTIKDWVLGEHRHVHVGAHGGLSEEEMYVPLILVKT